MILSTWRIDSLLSDFERIGSCLILTHRESILLHFHYFVVGDLWWWWVLFLVAWHIFKDGEHDQRRGGRRVERGSPGVTRGPSSGAGSRGGGSCDRASWQWRLGIQGRGRCKRRKGIWRYRQPHHHMYVSTLLDNNSIILWTNFIHLLCCCYSYNTLYL